MVNQRGPTTDCPEDAAGTLRPLRTDVGVKIRQKSPI